MAITFNLKSGGCSSQSTCLSKDGCPTDVCPDFTIRRHDTKPVLKVAVEDCDGPMDLRGLVVEVNMWALAKLKAAIDVHATYFQLADNIGFQQIMIGDIIIMDRVRMPEYMLVTGFDEINSFVQVQRAYHGTTASPWKKGTTMRIFRVLSAGAESEMAYQDQQEVDGTTTKNVLTASYLVYDWQPEDTCLPGCYWLEFKVLKMINVVWYLPGGNWTGSVFKHTDGYFYTGTSFTDSSVKLSFNQIDNRYYIPDDPWAGEVHLNSDSNYYTGTIHNDGSVPLNKTGIPSSLDTGHNSMGLVSITPSFTDEGLHPSDFGCILGEGVEWVRRFPIGGEGFLIRISDSATKEL